MVTISGVNGKINWFKSSTFFVGSPKDQCSFENQLSTKHLDDLKMKEKKNIVTWKDCKKVFELVSLGPSEEAI